MSKKGMLKEYLFNFQKFVIENTVEVSKEIVNVITIAQYPDKREIWCVFVYDPEIEDIESRIRMWTNFWEKICEKREVFYSEFKKPSLGYITTYPLFISKKKLQSLINTARSKNDSLWRIS